jgi:hypothetical protein
MTTDPDMVFLLGFLGEANERRVRGRPGGGAPARPRVSDPAQRHARPPRPAAGSGGGSDQELDPDQEPAPTGCSRSGRPRTEREVTPESTTPVSPAHPIPACVPRMTPTASAERMA